MVVLALFLFAPAHADEPVPAPIDCATLEGDAKAECENKETEAKLAALGDCSAKDGDDKAACEKEKADLEARLAAAAPTPEGKGGKAQRSNTNRMEADVTEE